MTIHLIIIAINCSIALFCFFIAGQIWQIRGILARAADSISQAQRNTDRALRAAPSAIERGQLGTYQLRQEYRALTLQQQRIAQILSLVNTGSRIWRSNFRQSASAPWRRTGNRHSGVGKARSR